MEAFKVQQVFTGIQDVVFSPLRFFPTGIQGDV
jgi:hypothetical protein